MTGASQHQTYCTYLQCYIVVIALYVTLVWISMVYTQTSKLMLCTHSRQNFVIKLEL
jgi:hypothetical protein